MATAPTARKSAAKPATDAIPDRAQFAMGENVVAEVTDGWLLVSIKLDERLRPSTSGKTMLIASTGGNVDIPGVAGGKVGINAYVPLAQ